MATRLGSQATMTLRRIRRRPQTGETRSSGATQRNENRLQSSSVSRAVPAVRLAMKLSSFRSII